jgi:hypothetical protein
MRKPIELSSRSTTPIFDPVSHAALTSVIAAHVDRRALEVGDDDEYIREMRAALPVAEVIALSVVVAEPFSANAATQVIDLIYERSSRDNVTPHPTHQSGTENDL